MLHPPRPIELDAADAARRDSAPAYSVSSAVVAADYFEALGAPIISGRGFHSADLETGARVVVVNQSFVGQVLGGRNPIGLRLRYRRTDAEREAAARATSEPEPWYEIVGVVKDLGMVADDPDWLAGLYHPAAPGAVLPLRMAVHVRGDPMSFAPRLRAVATAVDPSLRLHELAPLDEVGATSWTELQFLFRLLVLVSAVALLLSLAAIYSVMAFTVSRRTREIGIRVALGSEPRRVVAAILARPLRQVGLGLAAGAALVLVLTRLVEGLSARGVGLVAAYMALMLAVCLLACVVPTRRALRVEPTEALRTDG